MAKTVVASFSSYNQAERAVDELVREGVDRSDISIVANNRSGERASMESSGETASAAGKGAVAGGAIGGAAGLVAGLAGLAIPGIGPVIAAGPLAAALTGAGVGAVAGGLIGGLTHAGVPEEEAGYYAEAVRRGGTLVTVRAEDDMAQRVSEVLDAHGAVDVHGQAAAWRQAGWTGFNQSAEPLDAEQISRERGGVLPIVQEELQIGKRQVERGGVRVYSRVIEQPVEEQVQLREEHAKVERRVVDRPATDADLATFKEGTIEVRERAEEAVVSKQARVVEEVVVGKETTERTETVRDSVRRTDVQVEGMEGQRSSADSDFRSHFQTSYGRGGGTYDEYEPAYRYGESLSSDNRYQGRDWDAIERDARRDWERNNADKPWERFKAAIRRGWEGTRNAVDRATGDDRSVRGVRGK